MNRQNYMYRQSITSGPPARKKSIPSLLGLVDIHCQLLSRHLRTDWSLHTSNDRLTNKILIYSPHNNHYHVYLKIGFKPAEIYLSRSQYLGNSSLFKILSGEVSNLPPHLGELKEALQEAHKLNQARKRAM